MNKELFDLASWVVETAGTAGAAASRAEISRERSVEIGNRNRRTSKRRPSAC
mgnify:FL=1